MGRKKRLEAVDKTTVYFFESDLIGLDSKNRYKAKEMARKNSLKAVKELAAYIKEISLILNCDLEIIQDFFQDYGEYYDIHSISATKMAEIIKTLKDFDEIIISLD